MQGAVLDANAIRRVWESFEVSDTVTMAYLRDETLCEILSIPPAKPRPEEETEPGAQRANPRRGCCWRRRRRARAAPDAPPASGGPEARKLRRDGASVPASAGSVLTEHGEPQDDFRDGVPSCLELRYETLTWLEMKELLRISKKEYLLLFNTSSFVQVRSERIIFSAAGICGIITPKVMYCPKTRENERFMRSLYLFRHDLVSTRIDADKTKNFELIVFELFLAYFTQQVRQKYRFTSDKAIDLCFNYRKSSLDTMMSVYKECQTQVDVVDEFLCSLDGVQSTKVDLAELSFSNQKRLCKNVLASEMPELGSRLAYHDALRAGPSFSMALQGSGRSGFAAGGAADHFSSVLQQPELTSLMSGQLAATGRGQSRSRHSAGSRVVSRVLSQAMLGAGYGLSDLPPAYLLPSRVRSLASFSKAVRQGRATGRDKKGARDGGRLSRRRAGASGGRSGHALSTKSGRAGASSSGHEARGRGRDSGLTGKQIVHKEEIDLDDLEVSADNISEMLDVYILQCRRTAVESKELLEQLFHYAHGFQIDLSRRRNTILQAGILAEMLSITANIASVPSVLLGMNISSPYEPQGPAESALSRSLRVGASTASAAAPAVDKRDACSLLKNTRLAIFYSTLSVTVVLYTLSIVFLYMSWARFSDVAEIEIRSSRFNEQFIFDVVTD